MYGAVAMIPYYLGLRRCSCSWRRARATRRRSTCTWRRSCAALSVLAKGLAGLGLPVIVFVAYLAFTWNWRRLRRAQLLLRRSSCRWSRARVVAVPWHHAMLIRHGGAFWNELFGDNHWRRMVIGRHGDRGTFEYFVRELGYGLLPWIALAPAALGWAVLRGGRTAAAAAGRSTAEARKQGIILAGRDLVRRRRTRWCRCR